MPTWAERSLNNALRGRGRGDRKAIVSLFFFHRSDKAFFVYGFSKNQRANIGNDEEQEFKEAAKIVLALTETELKVRLKRGDLVEARANEQEV